MTVQATTTEALMDITARTLAVDVSGHEALLKAALRRAAFILAPSTATDIVRFVAQPLQPLGIARDQVEQALDELIVYGDVLELHSLRTDPWGMPAVVLRPAPPCFVKRGSGDFVILGVAGDFPTALTAELQARVIDDGRVRKIKEHSGERLAPQLGLLGVTPLSEQAWLRTPTPEQAAQHIARWKALLERPENVSPVIPDLEILDWSKSVRFYRGRWCQPTSAHTGMFVARRPQEFGARLWCVVTIEKGLVRKLIDIRADDDRQRPCDLAWRLQMAIDSERGSPQSIVVSALGATGHIAVFSPLPGFAERRLALISSKSTGNGALFRYEMATQYLESEVDALSSELWLVRTEG